LYACSAEFIAHVAQLASADGFEAWKSGFEPCGKLEAESHFFRPLLAVSCIFEKLLPIQKVQEANKCVTLVT